MRRPFNGTYPVTQEWGVNPDSYARFGLKGHNGVDYGTPTGTEIVAPHNGKVIEALYDQYGYGNYLKIENDQEGSILAHLREWTVNVGDTVSEGQTVGISDNTGNSTGPHLHWGYYRKPRNKSDGFSGTCNPYPYLVNEPITNSPISMSEQDKKDIESMKKLREYNGVWYEAKDILADFEKLKEDRATDNRNSAKAYADLDKLYEDLEQKNNTLQEENAKLLAEDKKDCQPYVERFRGKSLAEKLKACIDIVFA